MLRNICRQIVAVFLSASLLLTLDGVAHSALRWDLPSTYSRSSRVVGHEAIVAPLIWVHRLFRDADSISSQPLPPHLNAMGARALHYFRLRSIAKERYASPLLQVEINAKHMTAWQEKLLSYSSILLEIMILMTAVVIGNSIGASVGVVALCLGEYYFIRAEARLTGKPMASRDRTQFIFGKILILLTYSSAASHPERTARAYYAIAAGVVHLSMDYVSLRRWARRQTREDVQLARKDLVASTKFGWKKLREDMADDDPSKRAKTWFDIFKGLFVLGLVGSVFTRIPTLLPSSQLHIPIIDLLYVAAPYVFLAYTVIGLVMMLVGPLIGYLYQAPKPKWLSGPVAVRKFQFFDAPRETLSTFDGSADGLRSWVTRLRQRRETKEPLTDEDRVGLIHLGRAARAAGNKALIQDAQQEFEALLKAHDDLRDTAAVLIALSLYSQDRSMRRRLIDALMAHHVDEKSATEIVQRLYPPAEYERQRVLFGGKMITHAEQLLKHNIYAQVSAKRRGQIMERLYSLDVPLLKKWLEKKLWGITQGEGKIVSICLLGSYPFGFRDAPNDADVIVIVDAPLETIHEEEARDIPMDIFKEKHYTPFIRHSDLTFVTRQQLEDPAQAALVAKLENAAFQLWGPDVVPFHVDTSDHNRIVWAANLLKAAEENSQKTNVKANANGATTAIWLAKAIRRVLEAYYLLLKLDPSLQLPPEEVELIWRKAVDYLDGKIPGKEELVPYLQSLIGELRIRLHVARSSWLWKRLELQREAAHFATETAAAA